MQARESESTRMHETRQSLDGLADKLSALADSRAPDDTGKNMKEFGVYCLQKKNTGVLRWDDVPHRGQAYGLP